MYLFNIINNIKKITIYSNFFVGNDRNSQPGSTGDGDTLRWVRPTTSDEEAVSALRNTGLCSNRFPDISVVSGDGCEVRPLYCIRSFRPVRLSLLKRWLHNTTSAHINNTHSSVTYAFFSWGQQENGDSLMKTTIKYESINIQTGCYPVMSISIHHIIINIFIIRWN